ncbi:transposase for insertion sequence element IS112 [Streptomyces sp. OM5714]|nr:transposase for insertion sequence element IS112 [Streptomyces sp. OM5714]
MADRALLVAAYWRTNLTMRQLARLFRVSKSAADRIIDHLGPMIALQPCKRFAKDTVLIVDGTLVTTRSPSGRRTIGTPPTDGKAWEESGAKAAVGKALTITDGGYPGTGLVIPHRRQRGQAELPAWKEEHNKSHKQVRACVEHVFARMHNLVLAR